MPTRGPAQQRRARPRPEARVPMRPHRRGHCPGAKYERAGKGETEVIQKCSQSFPGKTGLGLGLGLGQDGRPQAGVVSPTPAPLRSWDLMGKVFKSQAFSSLT